MHKNAAFLMVLVILACSCADTCEHAEDLKSAYKTVTSCTSGESCKAFLRVGDGCDYDFTPWDACGLIAINTRFDVFSEGQRLDRLHRLAREGCFSMEPQCSSCAEPAAVRSRCDETTGRCVAESANTCRDDADCPYGRVCCPETEVCSVQEDCPSRAEEDESESEK